MALHGTGLRTGPWFELFHLCLILVEHPCPEGRPSGSSRVAVLSKTADQKQKLPY